jgi:LPS-assembly protein
VRATRPPRPLTPAPDPLPVAPATAIRRSALALLLCAGTAFAQADGNCSCAGDGSGDGSGEGVTLRLERALGGGRGAPASPGPVYLRARQVSGELEERAVLHGAVEVRRDGTVLRAEDADYEVATDRLRLAGGVRMSQGPARFEGPSLDLRLEARTGSMPHASYTYAARGGRGTSRLVEFLGDDDIRLHDATYTTCQADDPAWWIRAEQFDIHRTDEVAVAHSTTFYFEGVPVFASPWFEVPLGEQRRSGLLTPGYGLTTRTGQEFTFPIYWNIAPNYDYTVTPDIMPRRGVSIGNEMRLLEPTVRGIVNLDVMPNDRTTGNIRDHAHVHGDYAPLPEMRLALQYERVSDDNYLIDFARNIISASPSVLPQEALLTYSQPHWNASLQLARSQTLASLLAVSDPGPYERVPDVRWNGAWLDWHGWDVATSLDLTRFQHPAYNLAYFGSYSLPADVLAALPTFLSSTELQKGWFAQDGSRFLAHPSLAYPLLAPGWFFVPRAEWDYTSYRLDPAFHSGQTRASRSLATWSLDAGLIFERGISLFGSQLRQTLEPRVYYAFAPYRDQSRLPNFDSAPADFNFAELFTPNSFTGNDRISQADQLTVAMMSRVIDDASGAQRLRVALGQRFYFGSQLVTIPGQAPRTDPSSDVLLLGSAQLARRWNVDANFEYSTRARAIALATVGIRYQPRAASVVNLTYRYENAQVSGSGALIDQVGASWQWPISSRFYAVGALNYSNASGAHGWIENLAGIEYKAGCWVGRMVVSRYPVLQPTVPTSAQTSSVLASQYNTTLFFQIELNGLTSVGQSPLDQLQRSIPGFHRVNSRTQTPSPFDFYD